MIHSFSGITATFDMDTIVIHEINLEPMYSLVTLVNSSQLSKPLQMLLDTLTVCFRDQKGVRHQYLNPKVVPKSSTSKNFAQGNPLKHVYFYCLLIYVSLP